jgi:hypothetical protein
VIVSALDFTPDFAGFFADSLDCGEGGYDAAVVDAVDSTDANCENLAGGRSTTPPDTVGSLPLTVSIDGPAATEGDFRDIVRGTPFHVPMTFSAAATINSTVTVSAGFARRHDLPNRVIARGIGTPLVLTPITLNSQIRLLWKARPALVGLKKVPTKLKVTGTGADGSSDTAVKAIVLR